MPEVLNVIMRAVHITSVVTLLGGILFTRLVLWPRLQKAAPETRAAIDESAAAGFRPAVIAAVTGLLLSGIYNIFSNPGHSPRYHMMLGIKLLLALHVFAVALLVTRPQNPRRARMLTGTLISGLAIILISAYLRRIF